MTRIGRVIIQQEAEPHTPCFRLGTENGRIVLGCWRFIGRAEEWPARAAVFERVS